MIVDGERVGDGFLFKHNNLARVMKEANEKKEKILLEARRVFGEDLDIRFVPYACIEGSYLKTYLQWKGDDIRSYLCPDECFCELETAILQHILNSRAERN